MLAAMVQKRSESEEDIPTDRYAPSHKRGLQRDDEEEISDIFEKKERTNVEFSEIESYIIAEMRIPRLSLRFRFKLLLSQSQFVFRDKNQSER